jgi:hypothetical protein
MTSRTLTRASDVQLRRRDWGGWRLANGALTYPTSHHVHAYRYRIDLARVTEPVDVLRWLAHISGKTWGTEATAGLLNAFLAVLDPAVTGRDGPLR